MQLDEMYGLGPFSAANLSKAGIKTPEQLRKMGAAAAYQLVKSKGISANLNLLWAIEGAITNVHWTELSAKTKTRLLNEVSRLEST